MLGDNSIEGRPNDYFKMVELRQDLTLLKPTNHPSPMYTTDSTQTRALGALALTSRDQRLPPKMRCFHQDT
jgi:hypothetical protein